MDMKQTADQMRRNPQLLQEIIQSEDGKQIMTLLRQSGYDLTSAAQSAEQGDLKTAAELLKGIMNHPEGRAILERLSRKLQ